MYKRQLEECSNKHFRFWRPKRPLTRTLNDCRTLVRLLPEACDNSPASRNELRFVKYSLVASRNIFYYTYVVLFHSFFMSPWQYGDTPKNIVRYRLFYTQVLYVPCAIQCEMPPPPHSTEIYDGKSYSLLNNLSVSFCHCVRAVTLKHSTENMLPKG